MTFLGRSRDQKCFFVILICFTSYNTFPFFVFIRNLTRWIRLYGHFSRSGRYNNLKTCTLRQNDPNHKTSRDLIWPWPEPRSLKAQNNAFECWILKSIHGLLMRLSSIKKRSFRKSLKFSTFCLWPDWWRHRWPGSKICIAVWVHINITTHKPFGLKKRH